MRVSNLDKTAEIADYEAEIVHHPAVEEQSHYEVIAEYPNGGKNVQKVIDVEAAEAMEASDSILF